MKIRLHRGSYDESIKTMEEIEATEQAIHDYLARNRVLGYTPQDQITVRRYSDEPRHGWAAEFIVTLDGSAVAFTDQPISVATNTVITGFRVQMPRDMEEFKDLPEIQLPPKFYGRFRVIPGDVPGLRRCHMNLTNLAFIWGDYGIFFNLKTDVTLSESDLLVSDHNVKMEIVEIRHENDGIPMDYGIGLAIQFLLQEQVNLVYLTQDMSEEVNKKEVQP